MGGSRRRPCASRLAYRLADHLVPGHRALLVFERRILTSSCLSTNMIPPGEAASFMARSSVPARVAFCYLELHRHGIHGVRRNLNAQGGHDATCFRDDRDGLACAVHRGGQWPFRLRLAREPVRALRRWIGQDGHDYVSPNNRLEPSDVQDMHVVLSGLDPRARSSSST